MEARGKRAGAGGGSGIRITLNSKQRIVGPWRADGQSASHTGEGSHQCGTQTARQVEGFKGWEKMCEPGTIGNVGDLE